MLGAERGTNNVAELTAFAEALVYLRDVEGTTAPAIVRPDSMYALLPLAPSPCALISPLLAECGNYGLMRKPAAVVSALWVHLHVKGHSSNKWNLAADRAAARGALGEARGVGARWEDWRRARAHIPVFSPQPPLLRVHAQGTKVRPPSSPWKIFDEWRCLFSLRR